MEDQSFLSGPLVADIRAASCPMPVEQFTNLLFRVSEEALSVGNKACHEYCGLMAAQAYQASLASTGCLNAPQTGPAPPVNNLITQATRTADTRLRRFVLTTLGAGLATIALVVVLLLQVLSIPVGWAVLAGLLLLVIDLWINTKLLWGRFTKRSARQYSQSVPDVVKALVGRAFGSVQP